MRLWALVPVLAVLAWVAHPGPGHPAGKAPAGTPAGRAQAVLAADFVPAAAGQGPTPGTSTGTPSLTPVSASATPVLQQVSGGEWQATVLVTGFTGGCPTTAAAYSLDTTSPDLVTGASSTTPPQMVSQSGVPAGSCEVTVTFTGLNQVPATATLVIDGTSALPLAVTRDIGYLVPVGAPIAAGLVLMIALLAWSLRYLRVFDRNSGRQKPFPRRPSPRRGWQLYNKGFWQHEVYASGAWSLTDSWATNIAAAIGLVTPVLTVIPATDLLFRGVALDRFAVMSAAAAGIAAAAPLAFAVLYARRLRKRPGVTPDAVLTVPGVTWPGSLARLTAPLTMTLAAGTLITMDPESLPEEYRPAAGQKADGKKAPQRMRVRLAEPATATLAAPAEAAPAESTPAQRQWIVLKPARDARLVEFPDGARVSLPGGLEARTVPGNTAGLPVGAAARISVTDWGNLQVTVPGRADGPVRLADIGVAQETKVCAPAGATIAVPWGATACTLDTQRLQAARVPAGSKIDIPAGSPIAVMAEKMALPGGSDITVHGAGVLRIDGPDPAATAFTLPGSDISSSHDDPSDDLELPYPVYIMPDAGARITVNGAAHVTVPDGLQVTAPYRDKFRLRGDNTHFQLRRGTDSLAGTVAMVIIAALVTIFGIGAQIGIAATLTWLSQANAAGLVIMGLILLGGAVFTLRYSVTAIGSLVDPQPGSTMSATTGTSFTL